MLSQVVKMSDIKQLYISTKVINLEVDKQHITQLL